MLVDAIALFFAMVVGVVVSGIAGEANVRVETGKALYQSPRESTSTLFSTGGIHVQKRGATPRLRKRDAVLSRTTPDDDAAPHSRKKRATDFSMSDADIIVATHNEQRGMVVPEAADMRIMAWDDDLATMAQQWTDGCLYEHGNPTNISPFSTVGQNLFIKYNLQSAGTPPNGSEATVAWYNENVDYNFEANTCQPNRVCGHYTQNVWASTYAVGCGRKYCTPARDNRGNTYTNAWLITCNYGPAGNLAGSRPYTAGSSCTKCASGQSLCNQNLCSDCSLSDPNCECRADCQNCATFNSNNCSCTCADGWRGTDCGEACENTDPQCGANPGWPPIWCDRSFVIDACPLMCGLCNAADPNFVCTEQTTSATTTSQAASAETTRPTAAETTTNAVAETTTKAAAETTTNAAAETTTNAAAQTPAAATGSACPTLICLNEATVEVSGCTCNCRGNFEGDICQRSNIQNQNGVHVLIYGDVNNWPSIQASVLSSLRSSLISYCAGRQSSFCCPLPNNTVVDYSTTGLTLGDDFPVAATKYRTPAYWIQVVGVSPLSPGICAQDDGGVMDPDVVLAAIKGDLASLESSLNVDFGETRRSGVSRLVFSVHTVCLLLAVLLLQTVWDLM